MSTEDTGAPNLDAMPRAELAKWAAERVFDSQLRHARALFPSRPRRYVAATRLLVTYAEMKSTAMGLREDGDIPQALEMEAYCERLYNRLPKFARW